MDFGAACFCVLHVALSIYGSSYFKSYAVGFAPMNHAREQVASHIFSCVGGHLLTRVVHQLRNSYYLERVFAEVKTQAASATNNPSAIREATPNGSSHASGSAGNWGKPMVREAM